MALDDRRRPKKVAVNLRMAAGIAADLDTLALVFRTSRCNIIQLAIREFWVHHIKEGTALEALLMSFPQVATPQDVEDLQLAAEKVKRHADTRTVEDRFLAVLEGIERLVDKYIDYHPRPRNRRRKGVVPLPGDRPKRLVPLGKVEPCQPSSDMNNGY